MWPDQPYAEARGSFLRPVPVFVQDPSGTPSKTVSVPCSYLPYIRGSLQQLLLQATWATTDAAELQLAQDRASTLIALFEECSTDDLPFACPYNFAGDEQTFQDTNTGLFGGPASADWSFIKEGWTWTDHDAGGGVCARACDVVKRFPTEVNIHHAEFTYDLSAGSFAGSLGSGIALYDSTPAFLGGRIVGASSMATGFNNVFDFDGAVAHVSYVRMIVTVSSDTSSCSGVTGDCLIRLAEVTGFGPATCQ